MPSVAAEYDSALATNPVSWSIMPRPPNRNNNPTITVILKSRDPDYHRNVTVSSVALVPPFRRIL